MSGLEEAVLRNIAAVGELSEIVRTSFGPNGPFLTSLVGGAVLTTQVGTSLSSTTWGGCSSLQTPRRLLGRLRWHILPPNS
jgi:hypothetical protein